MSTGGNRIIRLTVLALGVAALLWTLLAVSQISRVVQHWRHGVVGAFFVASAVLATLAAIAAQRHRPVAVTLAWLVVIILAMAQVWLREPWVVLVGPGLIVGVIPAALAVRARPALR